VKKTISLLIAAVLLSACDQSPTDAAATSDTAVASIASSSNTPKLAEANAKKSPTSIHLLYNVEEPNVDPYESRIIITDKYIRLDDNNDGNEFVLVDRAEKIVYSVSDENDAILVVKHQAVSIAPPLELKTDTKRTPDKNSPKIDGHDIAHYIFNVNGEACQDALIAEGLLMNATAAIAEYRRILAGQHAKTFNSTPADLHNTCDMALHIFQSDRYLKFGLPIHERDHTGYQRSLIDFDDAYEPKPSLFILPENFEQFSIDEMQAPTEEPLLKSS